MIVASHLCKSYDRRSRRDADHGRAVDDVSFTVRNGLIYGLLGPNGAGKSTTMNLITGCIAPDSGTVTVNGYDMAKNPVQAKRQIGYLSEIPPLFEDMTPSEYLEFVAGAKGIPSVTATRQIHEVMVLTDVDSYRDRLIGKLSKGQKQRVGIAQALLGNPDIIILDEPTVGLDPVQVTDIRRLITRLGEKKTVIISSHILSEIQDLCQHIIIMNNGRIVADEDTDVLLGRISPDSDGAGTVEITAKGDTGAVSEALLGLSFARNVNVVSVTDSVTTVNLEIDAGTFDDSMREAVYFALADSHCILLSCQEKTRSLEDVFLQYIGVPSDAGEQEAEK